VQCYSFQSTLWQVSAPHSGKTGGVPHSGKTGAAPHLGKAENAPHSGKTGGAPAGDKAEDAPHLGKAGRIRLALLRSSSDSSGPSAEPDNLAVDHIDNQGLRFLGKTGHADYAASYGYNHFGTGVQHNVPDFEVEALGSSVSLRILAE